MSRKSVLIILIVLGISSTIVLDFYIHPVKATWVEGHITQDTTWKIQENPFIVTGDITVDQNATLTIDPGVEVKFGGDFLLTIEGNLSAVGTQDTWITFTSNKLQPASSDWKGMSFSGGNMFLRFCLVEYPDGISLSGNGKVTIDNCRIYNTHQESIDVEVENVTINNCEFRSTKGSTYRMLDCHRSGLLVSNCIFANCTGTAAVTLSSASQFLNNTVENCRGTGLYVQGLQNVTIDGNIIKECVQGIDVWWSGDSLHISNNRIHNNTEYGIQLYAVDTISNTSIHSNMIDSNGRGFNVATSGGYIESSVRAYNNSICYNTYGIYVEALYSVPFEAHYNDIYSNTFGAYVAGALCNATYNYWGDESGPYHVSMNPTGKGNPVNGNGVNLDFIPFLTSSQGHINQPPVAHLQVDKTDPTINETVTFDASSSTDDGRVDYFFFDFGDGTNSSWTTLPVVTHKYSAQGNRNVTLVVMDDYGVTSLGTSQSYTVVNVVPEFPSFLILPPFMIATLLAVIAYRKKHSADTVSS